MKILLVNCVYAHGSTGKIMVDLYKGLTALNQDVYVCYGRGGGSNNHSVIKLAPEWIIKFQSLCSKITGKVYGCSPISTLSLKKQIKKIKPDVVNLHCINANTANVADLIVYLKENKIPTVLTNHSEFFFTGGCGYSLDCDLWKTGCHDCPQFKKKNSQLPKSYFIDNTRQQWALLSEAYKDFKELLVTCVSPWLAARAKQSPFFKGREVLSVLNGLDTLVFYPRTSQELRKRHSLSDVTRVILHVTPNFYSPIKGGEYVLQIAERLKVDHPEWKIIVVGYNGTGEDLYDNMIPVSFTKSKEELAEYYSMANVTLLTSEKETFSMICAESLCCGTPIVGFEAGGPETISIKEYSKFTAFGDVEMLYESLLNSIDLKSKNLIDTAKALEIYSIEKMAEDYLGAYEKILYTSSHS